MPKLKKKKKTILKKKQKKGKKIKPKILLKNTKEN